MGKARILQAHGAGRYTIEIIEARERAEAVKQQALARIQTLQAEIIALEQRIVTAQSAVDQTINEQDAAINQYQQEMSEHGQSGVTLEVYARAVLEAAGRRDALRTEQRSKALRIAADQALVARVDSLPPLRQVQAWCADYSEDLSGEVATAEVPGEIGSVIIKPGFEGNAWSATADGAIQPALASTAAGAFYNLAMMPGWQKWRPTFRTATVVGIDGDTCSITLDAATSSQQGLGVNAQGSYSSVPILYMDCNGGAFDAGDRVLVAFAGNVDGPTVVGFESEPRVCCQPEVLGMSPSYDSLEGQWPDWPVLDEFEDSAITGGPLTEWRIITSAGLVVYSGGVIQMPDGIYRLDGLPEIATTAASEAASQILYSRDDSKEHGSLVGNLSFPTRPDFAGGRWYRVSVTQFSAGYETRVDWANAEGNINSSGDAVDLPSFLLPITNVTYSGEASWDGVTQRGGAIDYRLGGDQLTLEKGCMAGGEIVWPD